MPIIDFHQDYLVDKIKINQSNFDFEMALTNVSTIVG